MGKAYTVVVEDEGCTVCHADRTFTVLGPDGVALSQSWAELEDAEWMADNLNEAYELGMKAQRG